MISACVLSMASCVVVPADISPTRFPMEVKNAFIIVTLFATNHSASNGRYKNISHVAVYVGNGKVVEALNESLGVVYRDVASTGKIVVIGRP